MGIFDFVSGGSAEMAKDTKQSTNTQRGSEKSKEGKQPGKPASQTSPHPKGGDGGKKK